MITVRPYNQTSEGSRAMALRRTVHLLPIFGQESLAHALMTANCSTELPKCRVFAFDIEASRPGRALDTPHRWGNTSA